MTHTLPENLKIELIDNKIVNKNNLLDSISKENDYEMLKEYYDFLTNNINVSSYEHLNIILSTIKSRLNNLEINKKIKENLEQLRKENYGYNRISLIEDKNDYYLKIINQDKSLSLLEIDNKNFLNLLISIAPTMYAEEFIIFLKTRYFRELPTYSLEETQISVLEKEHASIIPDKSNYQIEKYMLRNDYPTIKPKVSINKHRVRLYHIETSIIKFNHEDGEHKKEILSPEEIIDNLKDNADYSENIRRIKLDDLEVEFEEAYPLIKKYITRTKLDNSELIKIYSYILNLLTNQETEFGLSSFEKEMLKNTINYIQEKERNNIEQEILNRYNILFEKNNEGKNTNKNSRKKTYSLNSKSPLILDDEGISLSIIIITLTILLGALIAVILLVK